MDYAFLNALVLAFAGGVVLNCMPCVFPILSIKVLSILKHRENDSASTIGDVASYTAGVSLSMFAISLVLIFLRATGNLLGWGFHMQSSVLVSLLVHITFLLGLSFSGFFDIPIVLSYAGESRFRNLKSFFAGALSSVVGTPCAAPFMVSAISFAMLQPWQKSILIFQIMSLGMAFPYIMFSCIPQAASLLPKPGKWMEYLRQFLAFPMYITSAWLLHVLVAQRGSGVVFLEICSVIALTMLIWGIRFVPPKARVAKLIVIAVMCTVSIFSSIHVTSSTPETKNVDVEVIAFSTSKLESLLTNRVTVFVTVGAEWCLTCKANETVINSSSIQNILAKNNVVHMKADWTNMDPEIANYLSNHGTNSIPFYVLYVDGTPIGEQIPQVLGVEKLSQILTKNLNKNSNGP